MQEERNEREDLSFSAEEPTANLHGAAKIVLLYANCIASLGRKVVTHC